MLAVSSLLTPKGPRVQQLSERDFATLASMREVCSQT